MGLHTTVMLVVVVATELYFSGVQLIRRGLGVASDLPGQGSRGSGFPVLTNLQMGHCHSGLSGWPLGFGLIVCNTPSSTQSEQTKRAPAPSPPPSLSSPAKRAIKKIT